MQVEKTIGKHIIPRYLYHVTTKQNYANMLREKVINTNSDKHFGDAFFMFDLQNFMKNWSINFAEYKNYDIRNTLFENIIRKQNRHDMVLLRIDTSKIDKENLLVRSVRKLFKMFYETEDFAQRFPTEKFTNPDMRHLAEGDSARKFHLYNQRKDAMEFAVKKKLDVNCAEYVSEFHYEKGDNVYDILKKAFANRNEKRAVETYSPHP